MFPVLCKNLRHQITIIKKPTSQILLHFNVFNADVIVHNLHQNPFLKSISNFSKSTKQQQPSLTVDYLVNSCGLPPEKALSAAKHFNLFSIDKADSVISLFQSYGFTKTHITKILCQQPDLLLHDANKNIKPKLEFLSDLGLSKTDVSKLVTLSSRILTASLENQIIPCFNFLNNYIGTNFDFLIALKRWPGVLYVNLENVLIPKISILQVHGVPDYIIAKMFITYTKVLCHNTDRFKEAVEKVKKLGFNPLSPMFCKAVCTITGLSESSWNKKLLVYREFGLLENDVISGFKKQPDFMNLSEERMRRVLEFFLKKLKCKPTDVSSRPVLLMLSLDKRVVPRCAALKILYSKVIINNKLNLYTVLKISEKDFFEKFVIKYQETVPEVMNAYKGGIEFEGFGEVVEVKDLYLKPVIDRIPASMTAV